MAKFNEEKKRIELTQSERKTFAECNSHLNTPKEQRKDTIADKIMKSILGDIKL